MWFIRLQKSWQEKITYECTICPGLSTADVNEQPDSHFHANFRNLANAALICFVIKISSRVEQHCVIILYSLLHVRQHFTNFVRTYILYVLVNQTQKYEIEERATTFFINKHTYISMFIYLRRQYHNYMAAIFNFPFPLIL